MVQQVLSLLACLVGVGAAAFAWRCWRRIALLRLHLERNRQDVSDLGRDLDRLRRRCALLRLAQLRGASTASPLPVRLLSQYGEDAIAWELLGDPLEGYFIEVGAHDGLSLSNTYFLESIGWHGMLIEAHPDLVERCRIARPGSEVVHAALGDAAASGTCSFYMVLGDAGLDALSFHVADDRHRARIQGASGQVQSVSVPFTSLNKLLSDASPSRVDFVSIDVEGAELDVLMGLDLRRWSPRLLVVEDNSGGVDTRVANYLAQFGYRKRLRCECNDFYMPNGGATSEADRRDGK